MDPFNWWPTSTASNDMNDSLNADWFIYGILSVLTQIDLVIYVLIWIAFTCTMTKNGMEFIRFQYSQSIKRRYVFVLGVYFLVGIVLGAFAAWSIIDIYLGFPIPFMPIVATVGIDLVLCYMMVCCYDLGRGRFASGSSEEEYQSDNDDDDSEDDECVCC
jgi:nitric oxide reductase large subunit